MSLNTIAELENYGVHRRNIQLFHSPGSPALLNYLDLLESRSTASAENLLPEGVAENQGRPLLFFVNEGRLAHTPDDHRVKLDRLRRNLACRGDRAYLAIVRPGTLDVIPVSLAEASPEWKTYTARTGEAISFFSRLANGFYDGQGEPDEVDFVFNEMFNLLKHGANRLAHVLGRANVLSLLGRTLFFRFLCDRKIVNPDDVRRICPKAKTLTECFENAENSYQTCQWLDRTFNGDFLSLKDGGSLAYFQSIESRSRKAFSHLAAIVQGLEPVGAEDYQGRLDWGDFNFAHVPVGLLSQVYEAFSWEWEHQSAKETSVHYTPRNIAATLVSEAFDDLPNAEKARVLDPACGAGVFLVLVLRRLYAERWAATRDRPDTRAIREILEKQIVGFDISDSALKLAALSLYLTAIELDPQPVPPEKLRFKELKNLVLFNHRREELDPSEGPVIGSLGTHLGAKFDRQFDMVLSNPPWTSLPKKEKKLAEQLQGISQAIIRRQGEEQMARQYRNPDYGPDLPFIWKSTEWCKPDGRFAMALPSRILFKQGDNPRFARESILHLIEVTAIINCSNLRKTNVWVGMDQPFMLLFARNRRPSPKHKLWLIAPHTDYFLNAKGEMRIDSKSAQPLELGATFDMPWIWKALTVATWMDVEIVQKIKAAGGIPLQTYWERELKLVSSNGYQIKAKQPQQDARALKSLPDLNRTDIFRFQVKTEELKFFNNNTAFRPRLRQREADPLRVYRGPLALIKESPGLNREDGRALLCFDDIVYNESFHGYSAAGHPKADLLTRYLHIFFHSSIWLHYALVTSPKLGAERPKIYKEDLDDFPIIPLGELSPAQHTQISTLSRELISGHPEVFEELDSFFYAIYRLDRLDREVIKDTLTTREPHDELGKRASTPPTAKECVEFRRRLQSVLQPFFGVLGIHLQIQSCGPDAKLTSPFKFLWISKGGSALDKTDKLIQEMLLTLAQDTGSTAIVQEAESGLLVGILNHYRYWTVTRARLLGAELLRNHMSIFED
ncbi:MAG: type restriction endonuclease subunit [Verrucomicrobiales bacterium]|nr:type restriction endonuclease subunit [Verrucomicrobiales bacterium]